MVPAISVEGVSVRFRPYVDRKPTLRKSVNRLRSREATIVTAVDDVTFQVEKGEAFGIVGSNGAGKSTLMRCMARTLQPDEGRVVVDGRLSTLLQLGVGFIPELSGRRNIYLGCLAHGLRRRQIDERFDQIVDYAGLWDAIDRPIKTYSSGMFSRLGFSVSLALEPDILLLDEVFAVGDESFREKSRDSMMELLDRSGTIVFVSHSLSVVEEFCHRTLWLKAGRVQSIGPSGAVIEQYRAHVASGRS